MVLSTISSTRIRLPGGTISTIAPTRDVRAAPSHLTSNTPCSHRACTEAVMPCAAEHETSHVGEAPHLEGAAAVRWRVCHGVARPASWLWRAALDLPAWLLPVTRPRPSTLAPGACPVHPSTSGGLLSGPRNAYTPPKTQGPPGRRSEQGCHAHH